MLAQQIRDGEAPAGTHDHLVRSVLARIAIDNPGYPSVPAAERYWPLP